MEPIHKFDRVLRVWRLLVRNPRSVQELAERLEVSPRTIYRYLRSLEEGLQVPLYNEKGRWAIRADYYLPPIRFSVPEALHIFLAARLMAQFDRRYNPHLEAAFDKLASALPEALKHPVQLTLNRMQKLARDEQYLRVLGTVAESWARRRRLRIVYRALEAREPVERTIAPYHIEPAAPGHASYIIAHCFLRNDLRMFKIERIESAALTPDSYEIPADFDPDDFLAPAWGVFVEGEVETVRLRIADPAIMRLMRETIWHPSQKVEKQRDGSLIMTLRVMDTTELSSWILSWGGGMEVLEPPALRTRVAQMARDTVRLYARG